MNKKRSNIILIIVLLAVCIGAGVFAAIKLLNKEAEPTVVTEEKTVKLLSFDSYQEVAGAKIRMENQFGKMTINADKKYITEGEGSLKVIPQGDYTKAGLNPYLQLDCMNTTFGTSDLSDLETITMDVYNNSDETVQVAVNFTIANYSETFMATPTVIYDLEPNAWTECVYNVSEEIVASYFNLANTRYMTIVFLDHKTSKDDTTSELYLDNLYGTRYDETPEVNRFEYDFYQGIGFEDIAEQYLVTGATHTDGRMSFQRMTYEEAGMTPAGEGFGEYLMVADATGSIWPAFTLNYGESIPQDTILSFWAYIDVETDEKGPIRIESQTSSDRNDRVTNTVGTGAREFNQWFPVKIMLNGAADITYTFFNFDDFDTAQADSIFGTKDVKIYFDNIKLEKCVAPVAVGEDGTITLNNPLGTSTLSYDVEKAYKAGQTVSFDIDFNTDKEVSIWVLAEGKWNTPTEKFEYFAKNFPTWNGRKTIMFEVEENISFFTICVKYFQEDGLEDVVCTIKNLGTAPSRASVSSDGTVTIKNPAGDDSAYVYDFKKPVKKGQTIAFDIDFNTKEAVAVWLLANGEWNTATNKTNELHAHGYEEWTGKKTISVTVDRDLNSFSIAHEYRGKGDLSKNVCTISNVRVLDPEATVAPDGTVIITNKMGGKSNGYDYMRPVKKGQRIAFDIDFNTKEAVAVWLLANGQWNSDTVKNNELYANGYEQWTGKQTIVKEVDRDLDYFRIVYAYRGEGDLTKNVCTISNIRILDPDVSVSPEGVVTVKNSTGVANHHYDVIKDVVAGSTFSFDIDFNTNQPLSVWVLGEGSWDNEWYAKAYDPWADEQKISITVPKDVSKLQIYMKYRGTGDYSQNIATISNIKIVEPEVPSSKADIALTNPNNRASVLTSVNKAVSSGSTVSFEVELNEARTFAVWLLGDGSWSKEYYANQFNNVSSTGTINVNIPADIKSYTIQIQYRMSNGSPDNSTDKTGMVAKINNLVVKKGGTTERYDGSLKLENPGTDSCVTYDCALPVAANGTISFDIKVGGNAPKFAVWIYEDAKVHYAYLYNNEGNPITVTDTNADVIKKFRIIVEFRNASGDKYTAADLADCTAEITNLKVTSGMSTATLAGGMTVQIANTDGAVSQRYVMNKDIAQGSTIKFDLDFNLNEAVAVWVIGDGDWNSAASGGGEFFVNGYSSWNGKTCISATATKAVSFFEICVQYRGANKTATTNMATITNLRVE